MSILFLSKKRVAKFLWFHRLFYKVAKRVYLPNISPIDFLKTIGFSQLGRRRRKKNAKETKGQKTSKR